MCRGDSSDVGESATDARGTLDLRPLVRVLIACFGIYVFSDGISALIPGACLLYTDLGGGLHFIEGIHMSLKGLLAIAVGLTMFFCSYRLAKIADLLSGKSMPPGKEGRDLQEGMN